MRVPNSGMKGIGSMVGATMGGELVPNAPLL